MGVVPVHFGPEEPSRCPGTRGILTLRQQKIAKIKENIMMCLMQWCT
jgi:hypothetical protein